MTGNRKFPQLHFIFCLVGMSRRDLTEAELSEHLLNHFQPEGSRGMRLIERQDPKREWSKNNLVRVGMALSAVTQIKFPRNYMRNRKLIYKWLTDNYDALQPLAAEILIDPIEGAD
jgi:hypothetical protein